MPLSSPPAAPQRGDRATFAQRVDAFITWLIGFVSELNIFSANLNSIAAGGAYAIPFVYDGSGTNEIDPGSGRIRFNNATQSQSTAMYVDVLSSTGNNVSALLDTFDDSSSAVKGVVRFQKVGDTSRWMTFLLTAAYVSSSYRAFSITPIGNFGAPFTDGDAIMLFFQRTGDKGDTGPTQVYGYMKVSDRKATGTSGGASTAGTIHTRTLNTVEHNVISGASLSSNVVTLPAGTYDIKGRAPASNAYQHRLHFCKSADNSIVLTGANASVPTTGGATMDATVTGRFTISATQTYILRHYINTADSNGLGMAVHQSGVQEIYAELEIWKVA